MAEEKPAARPLTFDQICEKKLPLYVRNKTGGIVMVTLINPINMKSLALEIPPTFAPFPLHERFSHEMLVQSSDLRAFLAPDSKVLRMMQPEEAEAQLNEPGMKEELARAKKNMFSNRSSINPVDIDREIDNAQRAARKANPNVAAKEEKVAPRIRGLMQQVETKDVSQKDAIAELRRLEPTLHSWDYSFIIAHTEQGSLKDYAKEQLAKIGPEEDDAAFTTESGIQGADYKNAFSYEPEAGANAGAEAVRSATEQILARFKDRRG